MLALVSTPSLLFSKLHIGRAAKNSTALMAIVIRPS